MTHIFSDSDFWCSLLKYAFIPFKTEFQLLKTSSFTHFFSLFFNVYTSILQFRITETEGETKCYLPSVGSPPETVIASGRSDQNQEPELIWSHEDGRCHKLWVISTLFLGATAGSWIRSATPGQKLELI